MKRRQLITTAATLAACAALPLRAQTSSKISFGYTAVSDFASVFVAAEEGLFKKHGLDVELKFIPLSSAIPAAIQSDSLQIGGPTPTVFLQSVDGGLDHVVLAGGGVLSKTYTDVSVMARAGSNIRNAQDFVGKKVGVPGLGALLHVTFRQWLKSNGVDYRQVSFIEAPFPQHADLIKGGSIDAVVTAGPFMARILDSGSGYVASYYTTFLPEGMPTVVHVAKRDWVKANPGAAKAFVQAVQEGAAFMLQPKNDAKVRAALGKYLRLPPPVTAKMQISPTGPVVTDRQLAGWIQMMNGQDMLKTAPAAASLIAK
ncbi:MAG: NitT/TauT family transport system substrate-binding protein [Comamonadaceae bacterium]|nr:MAG: NitT/TauT family transport system substrate-binding protein [Comamonadaceae bacterium]